MIRRGENGTWILVAQPDHARLAAEFADAWGAPGFASPDPRAETLLAVREHDNGWREWEAMPTVNAAGAPRSFAEMEIADHLAIWGRGVPRLARRSPYAALLVSMHADALFAGRLDPPRDTPRAREQVALFRSAQERRQQALRRKVEADPNRRAWLEPGRLAANFQLLQLCDYLSLRLCSPVSSRPAELYFPALQPGGPGKFRFCQIDATTASLDPFPFAAGFVEGCLRVRRVPVRRYGSDGELREALAAAERCEMMVKIARPCDRSWQTTVIRR